MIRWSYSLLFLATSLFSMEGLPNNNYSQNKRREAIMRTVDGCILKWLINVNKKSGPKLLSQAAKNVVSFFSITKAAQKWKTDPLISEYVINELIDIYDANVISAASYLPIFKMHNLLQKCYVKEYEGTYKQELKETAQDPSKIISLKGLLLYDTKGFAFKGLPRITPLMIAVGSKNEKAVDAILAESKKRNMDNQWINFSCPQGTSTVGGCATDPDLFYFTCLQGYTAVHVACYHSDVSAQILEKLLQAGLDPNAGTQIEKEAPLCLTCNPHHYQKDKAMLLIAYGAKKIPATITLEPDMKDLFNKLKKENLP